MSDRFPGDWLSFSPQEKRGILMLMGILILVLVIRVLPDDCLRPSDPAISDSTFTREVNHWLEKAQPRPSSSDKGGSPISPGLAEPVNSKPFRFDPNKADSSELEKLGLSPRAIHNLVKYRHHGGTFSSASDLKKIYGLDSTTFRRLKPYIQIDPALGSSYTPGSSSTRFSSSSDHPPGKLSPPPPKTSNQRVELNRADAFALSLLPGIGPVYARRICKYRDLLGGFARIKQLEEVYGMDRDLVTALRPHLKIDTQQIRKICLDTATFRQLIRHPYLSAYQTKTILRYRDFQRGQIDRLPELLHNNILDLKTYRKMKPYFRLEHKKDGPSEPGSPSDTSYLPAIKQGGRTVPGSSESECI